MEARRKIKLKDIAEIFSGIYEKTDKGGNVVYLQTKDCGDTVATRNASYVFLNTKTRKNLLRQGDVLFACKGVNYICSIYRGKEKAVASTSFFVIRLKSDGLSPEYLCWFLRAPMTESYFKTFQVGSGTPLIRKQNVEELEIPVPSPYTQQLIVNIARLAQREKFLQETIIRRKQLVLQQLLMNKTI